MGIASLVLGIFSLVSACFFGPFAFIGSISGILAVIFGAVGKKNSKPCSTAGLVCGIIGIVWGLVATIACAAWVGAAAAAAA